MYLHCITGDRLQQWLHWLSWAKYYYNIDFHSSLRTPLFNVVYGAAPVHRRRAPTDSSSVVAGTG
jgi:hypothetical protein